MMMIILPGRSSHFSVRRNSVAIFSRCNLQAMRGPRLHLSSHLLIFSQVSLLPRHSVPFEYSFFDHDPSLPSLLLKNLPHDTTGTLLRTVSRTPHTHLPSLAARYYFPHVCFSFFFFVYSQPVHTRATSNISPRGPATTPHVRDTQARPRSGLIALCLHFPRSCWDAHSRIPDPRCKQHPQQRNTTSPGRPARACPTSLRLPPSRPCRDISSPSPLVTPTYSVQ